MITNVELFNALRNVTAKREGSRYRILMELYTIGKGTSQRVLVDSLQIRPATVSEQLDVLIQLGFVEKTIDTMDKGTTVVTLTDAGKAEAHSLVEHREQQLAHRFRRLSPEDRQDLYDLLGRID